MFVDREMFDLAIKEFMKSVHYNPGYAIAYFDIGSVYMEQKKYDMAEKYLKLALAKGTHYTEAFTNLAFVYGKKGMVEQELETLKKAVQSNPCSFIAHFNLGILLANVNRQEMAKELEIAARLNPNYKELHYNLGLAYEKLGRKSEALGEYEKEIALNPEQFSAHKNAGILYHGFDNLKMAVYHFREYLRLNPSASDAEPVRREIAKIEMTQTSAGRLP
jgi:tetratricopeptide (TPR) repeat protein